MYITGVNVSEFNLKVMELTSVSKRTSRFHIQTVNIVIRDGMRLLVVCLNKYQLFN